MTTYANNNSTGTPASSSPASGVHKGIWIGGGVMAVAIVALATTLAVKTHDSDDSTAAPLAGTAAATAPGTAGTGPVNESVTSSVAAVQPTPAPVVQAPAPVRPAYQPRTTPPNQNYAYNEPRRDAVPVCHTCGVVESYDAIRVEGQTNGLGAATGGVGGALIGSQIAGRGNHTVGGLVGAIGGGLIGNAIEKRERTVTEYDVHVRMNDGTMRTFREPSVPAVGSHVKVEGGALHRES